EGVHSLSANYSGDLTFQASSGTVNVYVQNHATNMVGTTYCNNGPILANGSSNAGFSNTSPYPSVIFVGDGVNKDISTEVTNVAVQLRSLSSTNTTDLHMLLVSPDGTRALDIWSSAGSSASLGNFTLTDSATTELPPTGPLTTGSYLPTNHNTVPD